MRRSDQEIESDEVDRSETDRHAMEAKSDVWSTTGNYVFRHHVIRRRKLHAPKADFPAPLWYIGVYRQTKKKSGCIA